jgi:hypothetical protein
MHIIRYTKDIFKGMDLKGADSAFSHATGVMVSQKKAWQRSQKSSV